MSRVMAFIKKQGYYILLGACAILIATIITLSVVLSNKAKADPPQINSGEDNPPDDGGNGENPPDPDEGGDIGGDELKFYTPTGGKAEIVTGLYVGTFNVKGSGVMFDAKKGDKVFSSGKGVVLSNGKNDRGIFVLSVSYTDHKVVVDYYGLDSTDTKTASLKAGDVIEENTVIGSASGKYNYGATNYEKVRIDLFELKNGAKGEVVKDFSTFEFETAEK